MGKTTSRASALASIPILASGCEAAGDSSRLGEWYEPPLLI
jgi:hypothetical protein